MIIAVDFDGTLKVQGKPNMKLINCLREHQARGDTISLWSCREGTRLKEAVVYLQKHGLFPNLVNRNHPDAIRMMGHDSRKIYADLYIDNKNFAR